MSSPQSLECHTANGTPLPEDDTTKVPVDETNAVTGKDEYGNDIPELKAEEDEEKKNVKGVKVKRIAVVMVLTLLFTIAISIVSYVIALKLGTRSMESLGNQLQDQIALNVRTELDRRMDPLAIFLRQTVDFIDENNIDVEDNSQLRAVIPLAHTFLNNYFEDSRCCFGAFINMQFPGDSGPFADDSAVMHCHGIDNPTCPAPTTLVNPKAQWVGVLHYSNSYAQQSGFYTQVLPRYPAGNATNLLYFKSYEGKNKMIGTNPENNIGFVPFPYGDGYWFKLNVQHKLTSKQIRFSPIFPFDLYPPIVLKTHATTPLYSLDGRRVGAMVTGFKLHFLSKFLASMDVKAGMFSMIVERHTGYVVSTSNVNFEPLNDQKKPTKAIEITTDTFARDLATRVVNLFGGNWSNVKPYHSRSVDSAEWYDVLFASPNTDDFLITFDYRNNYGIDWVGIIHIPYSSIMNDIQTTQLALGIATVIISVALRFFSKVIEFATLKLCLPLPSDSNL